MQIEKKLTEERPKTGLESAKRQGRRTRRFRGALNKKNNCNLLSEIKKCLLSKIHAMVKTGHSTYFRSMSNE